ncbi:MAG: hypothetical protein ACTFAK_07595 [Candidatus Electronema sp. VV]
MDDPVADPEESLADGDFSPAFLEHFIQRRRAETDPDLEIHSVYSRRTTSTAVSL